MRIRHSSIVIGGLRSCVALAFLMTFSVQAQLEPQAQTGSRLVEKPTAVGPVRAGYIRKNFARCIVGQEGELASQLMLYSDPMSIDWDALGTSEAKLGKDRRIKACLGQEANITELELALTMSPTLLRAALMEEAYLKGNDRVPKLAEGAMESLDRTFVSKGDDRKQAEALAAFADCIVFKDSFSADTLLRTAPATVEERTAAKALAPTLGACLSQGQAISLTPANIRMVVADGLWNRFARPSTLASLPAK